MNDRKREGFTLVELLVVIVIVAILAGMMLLTLGSTVSMAEATKIVSELRTLHSAVLFYYLDNNPQSLPARPNGSTDPLSEAEIKSICIHMEREPDTNRYGALYLTEGPGGSGKILLGVKYDGVASSTSLSILNQRLSKMAAMSGLCNSDGSLFTPTATTDVVYIWVK